MIAPEFKNAIQLTPLQLNAFVCETKHTVLTPELLEQFSKDAPLTRSEAL